LLLAVAPGGVFAVEGAGFEAAMEDADEAVGESAQGVVVVVAGCALLVVKARAPGETPMAAKAWPLRVSTSRSLCTNRAATTFLLPEARLTGLVSA
jgi:hypothetical protein